MQPVASISSRTPSANASIPIRLDDGPSPQAASLEKKLKFLPSSSRNFFLETIFTGSFIGAIMQSIQQMMLDMGPKSIMGGILRAKPHDPNINWDEQIANLLVRPPAGLVAAILPKTAANENGLSLQGVFQKLANGENDFNLDVAKDESTVEMIEYLVVYFLSTIAAITFVGRSLGAIGNLNYEFLGHPYYLYEENLGKQVTVGKVKPKVLEITPHKLAQISLMKTMLFSMVTFLCATVGFSVPSIRSKVTQWLTGISDYSELLGFENRLQVKENPMQKADNIIKTCMTLAGVSVPAFLGLTWALNKNIHRPGLQKFFRRTAMHFDMSRNFGLSRVFVTVPIMVTALGYVFGSRNQAEALETFNRAVLWAGPAVVAYKQAISTFFSGLVTILFGAGGDLPLLFKQMRGLMGKGKRDFMNWDMLADFAHDKKTGAHSGLITELPKIRAMTEPRRQALFKLFEFGHRLPYMMALLVGFVINWFNFNKITEMHNQQKHEPALQPA